MRVIDTEMNYWLSGESVWERTECALNIIIEDLEFECEVLKLSRRTLIGGKVLQTLRDMRDIASSEPETLLLWRDEQLFFTLWRSIESLSRKYYNWQRNFKTKPANIPLWADIHASIMVFLNNTELWHDRHERVRNES